MTKKQAQAEVDKLNALPSERFCPLANDLCRKNCVCYQKAYITGKNGNFTASQGYCDNGMFSKRNYGS